EPELSPSGNGGSPTVGAEGDDVEIAGRRSKDAAFSTGRACPHLDGVVVTRRDEMLAATAERDTAHRPGVRAEGAGRQPAGRVPDRHAPVAVGACERAAVRAESEAHGMGRTGAAQRSVRVGSYESVQVVPVPGSKRGRAVLEEFPDAADVGDR